MTNGEAKKRRSGAFSAGICGCLPMWQLSPPATVGALGVIIGARISDTLVSH
jgi:hypothetical protein